MQYNFTFAPDATNESIINSINRAIAGNKRYGVFTALAEKGGIRMICAPTNQYPNEPNFDGAVFWKSHWQGSEDYRKRVCDRLRMIWANE